MYCNYIDFFYPAILLLSSLYLQLKERNCSGLQQVWAPSTTALRLLLGSISAPLLCLGESTSVKHFLP